VSIKIITNVEKKKGKQILILNSSLSIFILSLFRNGKTITEKRKEF